MTGKTQVAVAALDALTNDDPEVAHGVADAILLVSVDPAVREAYERVKERIGFWYA